MCDKFEIQRLRDDMLSRPLKLLSATTLTGTLASRTYIGNTAIDLGIYYSYFDEASLLE